MIAKTPYNVKDLINIKLDPFSHLLYSGIYEISFIYRNSSKRSKYIGETIRSLKVRIKEHVGAIKFKPHKASMQSWCG